MIRLTASEIVTMYGQGFGVRDIMAYTGMAYVDVTDRLGDITITGGPHDTEFCRHDHELAKDHLTGVCQHPAGRPHTKASRAANRAGVPFEGDYHKIRADVVKVVRGVVA